MRVSFRGPCRVGVNPVGAGFSDATLHGAERYGRPLLAAPTVTTTTTVTTTSHTITPSPIRRFVHVSTRAGRHRSVRLRFVVSYDATVSSRASPLRNVVPKLVFDRAMRIEAKMTGLLLHDRHGLV